MGSVYAELKEINIENLRGRFEPTAPKKPLNGTLNLFNDLHDSELNSPNIPPSGRKPLLVDNEFKQEQLLTFFPDFNASDLDNSVAADVRNILPYSFRQEKPSRLMGIKSLGSRVLGNVYSKHALWQAGPTRAEKKRERILKRVHSAFGVDEVAIVHNPDLELTISEIVDRKLADEQERRNSRRRSLGKKAGMLAVGVLLSFGSFGNNSTAESSTLSLYENIPEIDTVESSYQNDNVVVLPSLDAFSISVNNEETDKQEYTIQSGDTLWAIAQNHSNPELNTAEYVKKLADQNSIADSNLIFPGQTLQL